MLNQRGIGNAYGVTHRLDEVEARLAILRQDIIMYLRKAKEFVQRFERLEADIKALRESMK